MCHPPRARSGRRGGAMTDVVIVDSGVANLASIASAFRRLGWNAVTAAGEGLVATGVAAFANSYALREAPGGWVPAWTTHGVRFVAALEQSGERLLACQFHPELSGAYGAALLERWLAGAKG